MRSACGKPIRRPEFRGRGAACWMRSFPSLCCGCGDCTPDIEADCWQARETAIINCLEAEAAFAREQAAVEAWTWILQGCFVHGWTGLASYLGLPDLRALGSVCVRCRSYLVIPLIRESESAWVQNWVDEKEAADLEDDREAHEAYLFELWS